MTLNQLAKRVLLKHVAIDVEDQPSPEQLALITAVYNEQYQILLNDSLISWGSTDDIPEEVVGPIVSIIQAETADIFQGVLTDKEAARRELSRILSPDYVPSTTSVDYY